MIPQTSMSTSPPLKRSQAPFPTVRISCALLAVSRGRCKNLLHACCRTLCSYNVVALPLAAGALKPWLGLGVTPALAALFMASSSSLVILSSLGLKLYTRPGEPTARDMAVSRWNGGYGWRMFAVSRFSKKNVSSVPTH